MRRTTIYQLSFRLTAKDIDLLWLDADDEKPVLSVLVKKALRALLQGEQMRITLPNVPKTAIRTKTVGIRFYKNEDEDIVDWLKEIQRGNRGLLVKEILRHAMETVDYRPYMIAGKSVVKISGPKRDYQRAAADKQSPKWLAPPDKGIQEEMPSYIPVEPEQEIEDAEDDWISAFEEMAKQ